MMKKCLVLDLDNTLWGGVVGEDGIDGIKLGLEAPGSSFVAFQQAILDLYNNGIILAISSKNNYDDAMNVIRNHPNMVLKEKHFAAAYINWDEKTENIKKIANELNIGLDSLVFLDDDTLNRTLMRNLVPEVETPDLPKDPEEYVQFLMGLPYFNKTVVTDEDKMRGNLYVTERLRKTSENKFVSRDDFLKDLKLSVCFYENDASCVSRLAQLTEKTNQFNMNKTPMSEEEISNFISSDSYRVYYATASDKFGDYGVIAFAVLKKDAGTFIIENMLMSCRALGRGIEDTFLNVLAERACADNCRTMKILFNKTEKNKPAEDFLNKYFNNNTYDLSHIHNKPNWVQTTWKK